MHDRESFQEQARHREWVVTQGWPVGSAKIGTVGKVFKNWGKRENGASPRGGWSDRKKKEQWRRFYTCPLFLSRGTSSQILRRTCGENMKLHILHTLEIERN